MSRMQNVQPMGVAAISERRVSANISDQKRFAPTQLTQHRRAGEPALSQEQQGWDAYRKWLSAVAPKSTNERARIDPSVYSWRGYHTWADKVRRSWDDDKA